MNKQKSIAVVGAGISGLACAYELQKAGHSVTVYEASDIVGGRMSSRKKDGLTFDIGANHLCNLYDNMKEYCQELDVPFESMDFLKYGIHKDGKIMDIDRSVGFFSRLRLAIEFLRTEKRSEWINFFNLTSASVYDNENAYDYMTRRLGKAGADYLVDPFSTTYQFHSSKEISLGAVKGILELLKFRREGWNLHQTPGGMIRLPQALADTLDVKLQTAVESVTGGNYPKLTTEKEKEYDVIVLASPATVTKQIYNNPTEGQKNLLQKIKYATSISLAFKVDKNKLPGRSVVWVPRVQSKTISGFTNERMKGGEFVHDDTSLICAWLHEDYAKSIINKSDDEILSETKTELLKFCPWFTHESDLENFDLQRWPEAMPKFYPGSITAVKTFLEESQGGNNVFFCGDYLNSPWTEGALRCGQRVAEDVMSSFSEQ